METYWPVSGVDFDDVDYGFKEENKSSVKVSSGEYEPRFEAL